MGEVLPEARAGRIRFGDVPECCRLEEHDVQPLSDADERKMEELSQES